ncbi:tyrosine-type recombinase/integrase [Leifsonia sp. NPDC080035]|uniref:Tyrosine-type recombinase/integrase n=1 Tax=Leifsonia sp. NPDC080035 TaxID=3143936 RepID=A0AAU7GCE0_9MICO
MNEVLAVASPAFTITNREQVLATIADEVAPATRKAYLQAMKLLRRYYETQGWNLYPLDDAGEFVDARFLEQVLSYLQNLVSSGRTYSTVNKTLSAIKYFAGYENARAYAVLVSKPTRAFMEGLARQTKSHTPKQAQSLTLSQVEALHAYLRKGRTPRDIRDRAMLSLGIATALRSQNLGELTLSDVSPAVSIDGVVVRVRFSKTDQLGKGNYIPVAKSPRRSVDPIGALNEWLSVLGLFGFSKDNTPDFPLFPAIRGRKAVQATKMLNPNIAITETLRNRLVEAAIATPAQAFAYSSHSLRATFITLASQAGVSEADIAAVSLHSSMATLRKYDRSSVERHATVAYLQ